MNYLEQVDIEKLRELWKQLDNFLPPEDYTESLLDELFESHSKSLRDSISLLSGSIKRRKKINVSMTNHLKDRTSQVRVALKQFPPLTSAYQHREVRRMHLERELDALTKHLDDEERSNWKDLQSLYSDLFYLKYKEQALEHVRKTIYKQQRSGF